MEIVVRGPFDRVPVDLDFDLKKRPSLTEQSHKAECDVNTIMKRYERDGLLTHVNAFQGDYGDFTGVQDYHTSMNQILLADEMFLSLPAKVREEFDNDPGKFLEFAENPDNEEKMRDMGLIPAKVDRNPGEATATGPSPSAGAGDRGPEGSETSGEAAENSPPAAE